jgi:cell division septation protein DedD
MKAALVAVLVLVAGASPARAWQPPAGALTSMARRVLDSLPEPKTVPIPPEVAERSRRGIRSTTPPPLETAPVPAPIGTCFVVQLTALGDPERARALAADETARLGVPVRVLTENGLSKLRAGECLDADAARALRDRARDAGYSGAFLTPGR